MEHLIIIGAAAAGTKTAAKVRRENPKLKITLFTDEDTISYSACGIPFFIEGEFDDINQLIEYTPEEFEKEFNMKVYTKHRVLNICKDSNIVEAGNLTTGEMIQAKYSKLLIATGARPILPNITGINAKNIFTVRTIKDAITIKQSAQKAKTAVIMGGGYIGIEMLEALLSLGIDTKLIEKQNRIMPILDPDMSDKLKKMIEEKFPNTIITSESIKSFIANEEGYLSSIELESKDTLRADIAIIALGVKPNIELAQKTGVEIGSSGAIKVNKSMQTSIENIYAAGDCCEKTNLISRKPVWTPLGSTANKEARVAALNIAGQKNEFQGVLGTAVTKFFDINIATTGLSEKTANYLEYKVKSVTIKSKDKAGYMKDSKDIILKIIADQKSKRILGAQCLGEGDADKRINILAAAITAKMTVKDFINIDISYAPPFSRAIDISTVAAYQMDKILEKNL